MELTLMEQILRLVLSLLLGAVVGLEREFTQQSAGLRTHILVCLGATVFTIVSISDMTTGLTIHDPGGEMTYRLVRDPARISAQIVAGIGFIGGGAVLRYGASVRGLTTAASLWTMASIGMLIGVGFYQLAVIATFFSFLVLFIIGTLERSMFKKHLKTFTLLRINLTLRNSALAQVEQWLEKSFPRKTVEVKTQHGEEDETVHMTYIVDLRGLQVDVNVLSQYLNRVEGVLSSTVKVFHEEKPD